MRALKQIIDLVLFKMKYCVLPGLPGGQSHTFQYDQHHFLHESLVISVSSPLRLKSSVTSEPQGLFVGNLGEESVESDQPGKGNSIRLVRRDKMEH